MLFDIGKNELICKISQIILKKTLGVYFIKAFGQDTKSNWWMHRHIEAMKDVASCEKLRGAAKQAVIRRFPNGATQSG
jgi:precorrin-6x reductase